MLRPSSRSSDSVTAAVTLPPTVERTRTSTPRPERGHRQHGEDTSGFCHRRDRDVRHELKRAQRGEHQKADDEPRHQLERADRDRPGRVGMALAAVRGDQREPDHDRPQHQHAHQFHQRADLRGDDTGGDGRRQHLRNGIDGKTRQNAVLRRGQGEQRDQQRQAQHHQDAEDRGEGDRRGDIVAIGADHGRHRSDCGIAADRIAAGDQDRHFGRQAEHPAEAVADREHDDDGGDDRCDQKVAGRHDRGKADGSAEQHDGDLEQLFGAEGNAGAPALGGLPGGANRHPEQDRDDQRFDIGVGEDALFDQLGAKRNGGDRAAKCDAGNEGQAAPESARVRSYPVRLVLLLRHMPPVLENSLCAGLLGFTNKFSIQRDRESIFLPASTGAGASRARPRATRTGPAPTPRPARS